VRIVFLDPSGELGGAETALLELFAALRTARPSWNLHLIASAPGPLVIRASALGVSSTALPFPPALARLGEWGRRGSASASLHLLSSLGRAAWPSLRYEMSLKRHLAALDPDIVHTNGFKMHVLGARCRPKRASLVWHLHDYPQARPVTAALLRAHARRCTAILANSQSVAGEARAMVRGAVPVNVIHNAVDLNRFTPEGTRLALDALSGLPPLAAGGMRVGLVGTLARWKGHDVFLRAMKHVSAPVPIRGYVIGDAIYQTDASQFSLQELRGLATSIGLDPERIGFTGRVEDVPAALRSLDIVVHASIQPEPFGLVIAEAMACGRPVIVSRAGGAAEIARAGAVFHQPGDAVELAERIAGLVPDAARRAALGAAARETAVELFARGRLADALVPFYESLR
jgi:glycosyltransferase involved in cell wall biosynthesis